MGLWFRKLPPPSLALGNRLLGLVGGSLSWNPGYTYSVDTWETALGQLPEFYGKWTDDPSQLCCFSAGWKVRP